MKIIVCGAPHSGKTVFVNSLYLSLPQNYTHCIRGCPDGESVFSSNADQNMIQVVRRKGDFSEDFMNYVCKRIETEDAPIVLIDVGGKRSTENERIFELADSCIVISSDKSEKEEWKKFADKFKLKTLATLDSSLEGTDVIISEEPYVDGIITNLNRGTIKEHTELFKRIRSNIIENAITQGVEARGAEFLKNENVINMYDVARQLNMIDKNTNNIVWDKSRIKDIYDFINGALQGRDSANFYETRAIWITALTAELAKANGISNVQYYSFRNNRGMPIRDVRLEDIKPDSYLDNDKKFEVYSNVIPNGNVNLVRVESEHEILMHFETSKVSYFTLEDLEKIVLPKQSQYKKIYFSGRFPPWLVASLVGTYTNQDKAVLQAGYGFVTFGASNSRDIGKVEKSPTEIDFLEVVNAYSKSLEKKTDVEH